MEHTNRYPYEQIPLVRYYTKTAIALFIVLFLVNNVSIVTIIIVLYILKQNHDKFYVCVGDNAKNKSNLTSNSSSLARLYRSVKHVEKQNPKGKIYSSVATKYSNVLATKMEEKISVWGLKPGLPVSDPVLYHLRYRLE